jgi:oxygen-dependent protoporphyrinogen oxidase
VGDVEVARPRPRRSRAPSRISRRRQRSHRLEATDEELVEDARDELEDLLDITGDPVITRLFRWTRQSPQYEVGHLQRVAAIDDHLAALPGVFLTGSGFRAIGIPDCIADARATAARTAAYLSARHDTT